MFELKFDEEQLKALYLEEVQKRLEKIELQTLLMDSKQLCKMLSLSWPTVEKLFLRDKNFPSIRIGSKWLFPRKEVEKYIEMWAIEMKGKAI
jgi:excisionase family DNA binding protein